jgi:nitroimidazol reductase NimA-like FMN-containing flavoprotein (pyridoxamine 5'-phosphate oxidase superfamily)
MYELRHEACEAVLARNTIGRLGCYSPTDQQVYVVPVSYGYHDGSIFFGSINGDKIEFLRAHPRGVCFEVDEVDDALNWTSVIVRGNFEELHGRERRSEKPAALQRAQRGPMHWLFDPDVPESARNALIIGAIRISDTSGRREHWSWSRPTPLPLSLAPANGR